MVSTGAFATDSPPTTMVRARVTCPRSGRSPSRWGSRRACARPSLTSAANRDERTVTSLAPVSRTNG